MKCTRRPFSPYFHQTARDIVEVGGIFLGSFTGSGRFDKCHTGTAERRTEFASPTETGTAQTTVRTDAVALYSLLSSVHICIHTYV